MIMRFFAIAVIFVALAARVTPTHGTGTSGTRSDKVSCRDDVEPCMEVVVSEANQCNGGTVTYCLQPKSNALDSCPNKYDHTNVYVNGADVNLKNPALPAATCVDTSAGVSKQCKNEIDDGNKESDDGEKESDDGDKESDDGENKRYLGKNKSDDGENNSDDGENNSDDGESNSDDSDDSTDGKKSCKALDGFSLFGGNEVNVGLKCKGRVATSLGLQGLCVTVPHTDGNHAQIIFAVKDGDGCEEKSGGWKCSGKEDNSCSCSDSKAACVWEDITSCTYCGNGKREDEEECDGGKDCTDECKIGPGTGGTQGDPHFKTWRGHHFDYHGECDLVLLHSSEFGSGLGLDVHIRTKLRRDMSYISGATVRIGSDVLEVESQGVYYFNGVANAELPSEFSGFAFSHTQPTANQHLFEVSLGGNEKLNVKTYKDFVSVLIQEGQSNNFLSSVGLMGDFGQGRMMARDGKTVLDDANAFGQEWQVLDSEPSLFQTLRLPQHPMECTLPPPVQASQLRRRLLETSSVDELDAEKACARWGDGKDDCVFDVLTTGDLEMAMVGAY